MQTISSLWHNLANVIAMPCPGCSLPPPPPSSCTNQPHREALQQFTPRQLRLMFCLQPWGKTMNYGDNARAEMKAREAALRNFFQNVEVAVRSVDLCSSSGKWEVRGRGGGEGAPQGSAQLGTRVVLFF